MEYSDLFSGDEAELRENYPTNSEGAQYARECIRILEAERIKASEWDGKEYSQRLVADQVDWLAGLARRNAAKADTPSDSVR